LLFSFSREFGLRVGAVPQLSRLLAIHAGGALRPTVGDLICSLVSPNVQRMLNSRKFLVQTEKNLDL